MSKRSTIEKDYRGFEQGPIRPPSEASSLLVRLTRNCPWNRCTFCSVYKRDKFSLRPLNHVLRDIDAVHRHVVAIQEMTEKSGAMTYVGLESLAKALDGGERMAFYAAANWIGSGMQSIFLQDGNSLVLPPDHLVAILQHLRQRFTGGKRITSYARSHTVDRISDTDLARIAKAGLNRIHIGMESGSDRVLAMVQKGAEKATHIRAGLKVKQAGIELSEYVMPGLGGRALSKEHALETADALNWIDPDFIRLRTLRIPRHTELISEWSAGAFEKLGDREVAEETLLFLEALDGIASTLKSDHILNLFEDAEGTFPEGKERITAVFRRFLGLPAEEQVLYLVGRRSGLFSCLKDLEDPGRRRKAQRMVRQLQVVPENVDQVIEELIKRFV